MSAWIWWAATAAVFGLIEVTTTTLAFLMLAGGAAAAAGLAALGTPVVVQVIGFAVVSVALLGAVRPVAMRHLRTPPVLRSGVAGLIGKEAVVVEKVTGHGGQVRIGGEVWSARAYDGQSELEVGSRVDVLQIEGATALVL